MQAIESGALSLTNGFNGRAANTAWQAGTVINTGLQLEMTRLALGVGEVSQGAATFHNCLC